MANDKGPNIKKKQKCKNCEGKGLLKKGDKVVKCQRCGGDGVSLARRRNPVAISSGFSPSLALRCLRNDVEKFD